jgi:hypothetical protein
MSVMMGHRLDVMKNGRPKKIRRMQPVNQHLENRNCEKTQNQSRHYVFSQESSLWEAP